MSLHDQSRDPLEGQGLSRLQKAVLSVAFVVLFLAGVGFLQGCDEMRRREYGPPLSEHGKVVDLPYVPAGHGSSSSVGFTTGGDLTFGGGSVDIPARYAIVFECKHGRFVVENRPALWKTLRVGQDVSIQYREIREGTESTGMRVVGLDFLGAAPR